MFDKEMAREEHEGLSRNYAAYIDAHPQSSPTERMILLNRLYEKYHYSVTSRDLARGYEIDYVKQDGKVLKLTNQVDGGFAVGGAGSRGVAALPIALYRRTRWKLDGKPMTVAEFHRDRDIQREINLVDQRTSDDILTKGKALLDHAGIDTGFGAEPGVISPVFTDLMLRKASEEAQFKAFVRQVPMPAMNFYFPLKTTVPTDDAEATPPAFGLTAEPTAEGRAGVDYHISFSNFFVNGWKFLRHASLTRETMELLARWITVQNEYTGDLALGMSLLWDYPISEGWYSMLTAAKWRRFETGGGTWSDEEFVPLSGTAGDAILTANAKKHILMQDLTPLSGNYGKIYEPDVTLALKWQASTLRNYSTGTDDVYELIVALMTLLKDKHSRGEFVAFPSVITERLVNDPRFLETIQATGNPAFESESGFLGQIAVGGSNKRIDAWEYDSALIGVKQSVGDTTAATWLPIFAGRYGQTWNHGTWLPFYLRVDDGFEVVTNAGVGGTPEVLRPNETRVITAGSAGTSFPGNFTDLVMGLAVIDQAHT